MKEEKKPIHIDLENLENLDEAKRDLARLIKQEYEYWLRSNPNEKEAFKLKKSISKDKSKEPIKYQLRDEEVVEIDNTDPNSTDEEVLDIDNIIDSDSNNMRFSVGSIASSGGNRTDNEAPTTEVTLSHSFISSVTEAGDVEFYASGKKIGKGVLKVVHDVPETYYILKKGELEEFVPKTPLILKRGIFTKQLHKDEKQFRQETLDETHLTNIVYPNSEHPPLFRTNKKRQVKSYTISVKYYDENLFNVLYEGKKVDNKKNYEKRTGLDLPKRFKICVATAASLKEIHQKKIIHLDVKPHNIIYNFKDDEAKVIDFNLSRKAVSPQPSSNGDPIYLAPDSIQTQKSDVFSFGVSVFLILGIDLINSDTCKTYYQPDKDEIFMLAFSPGKAQAMLALFDNEFKSPPDFPQAKPLLRLMLVRMLSADPKDRPTAAEVYTFFTTFNNTFLDRQEKLSKARKKIVNDINDIEEILKKDNSISTEFLANLKADLLNEELPLKNILDKSTQTQESSTSGIFFDKLNSLKNSENGTILENLEKNLRYLGAHQKLMEIQSDIIGYDWIVHGFGGETIQYDETCITKTVPHNAADMLASIQDYITQCRLDENNILTEKSIKTLAAIKKRLPNSPTKKCYFSNFWRDDSTQKEYFRIRTDISTWLNDHSNVITNHLPIFTDGSVSKNKECYYAD